MLVLVIVCMIKMFVLGAQALVTEVDVSALFNPKSFAAYSLKNPYSDKLVARTVVGAVSLNPYYLYSIVFSKSPSTAVMRIGGFYQPYRPARYESFNADGSYKLVDVDPFAAEAFCEGAGRKNVQLATVLFNTPFRFGVLKPKHLTGKKFFLNSVHRFGRKNRPELRGYNAIRRSRWQIGRGVLGKMGKKKMPGGMDDAPTYRTKVKSYNALEPHRVTRRPRRWLRSAKFNRYPLSRKRGMLGSRRRLRSRARYMYDWRKPWRRASGRLKKYVKSTIKRRYVVDYRRQLNRIDYTAWRRVGSRYGEGRRRQQRRLVSNDGYTWLKYPFSRRIKRFFRLPFSGVLDTSGATGPFRLFKRRWYVVPGSAGHVGHLASLDWSLRPAAGSADQRVPAGVFKTLLGEVGVRRLCDSAEMFGVFERLHNSSTKLFIDGLRDGMGQKIGVNWAGRQLIKNSLIIGRRAGARRYLHGPVKLPVVRAPLPPSSRFSSRRFVFKRVWAAGSYWNRNVWRLEDREGLASAARFFNGRFPFALVPDNAVLSFLEVRGIVPIGADPVRSVNGLLLVAAVVEQGRQMVTIRPWYVRELLPSSSVFRCGRRFVFLRFKKKI